MPGKKKRKQKDFGQNSVDVSSTHEVNNNLQSTDRRASFPLNSGQLYNINNNGIGGGRKNYKRLSSDTDQLIQSAGRVASGKRGSAESWESIANAADVTKQGASDFDNDVKLPAEYILMGDMAHNKRRVSGHRNSYKKAIQKAGYNMNELVLSTTGALSPIVQRRAEPKSELDWTENALPNDHIWSSTNASGDLCYVGEQNCMKSGPRKKCSACHIVVHDQCLPLLERIGFQCKVTFRESSTRSLRENQTVHHHWVHRRKQEGKCKHCSKSFDKRFGFRDTKIIAISCSWCKEAFHNKVSCFQIHKINEPCSLGTFFRTIIPPTWIVKSSAKQKSIRNRSKKKRGSGGNWRKKSSKEIKQRTFIIRPPSQQSAYLSPILVFINPKSGGNQGAKLMQSFQWAMNPRQVIDLSKGGPQEALELYRKVPNLRILACGGDGTVGWVLSVLDKMNLSRPPPVAILPLGTGNDLSRTLNFGAGYSDESVQKIIQGAEEGRVVKLDRWKLHVEKNECEQRVNEDEVPCEEGASKASDKPPIDVVNNYFSIGADALVTLEFHESREAKPSKFNSRLRNKIFYARTGVFEYISRQSKDLFKHITVVCDGKDITPKIRELKPVCIVFLNIPRFAAGTTPWGNPTGSEFQAQRHDDKLMEVLAFSLNQLGMIFVGGHGERLCQCKSAYIKTDKIIPVQIDGEPCRLNPSNIRLEFFNQASMVYRTKRRPSINPDQQQVKIRVNALTSSQYDEFNGRLDKLCSVAAPRLVTIVTNNATLSSVRTCWETVNAGDRGPGISTEKWMFLDASRHDKLYLIDRTQEHLHLICDVITSDRDIYLMDLSESKPTTSNPHTSGQHIAIPRTRQVDRRSVTFRNRVHSDSGLLQSSSEMSSVSSTLSSVKSTQDVRSPGFSSHFEVENDPDPRSSYLDVVFENVVKGSEGEAPCQSMSWGEEDPTNTVEDAKDWVDADENDEEVGGNPSNGGAGESRVEPDSGKVELCDVIEPCTTTPSGGGGLDSEQPTSTTSSPVIRQSRPASECSSHSTSSNEYLVCDDHSDMTRHKSMMTQRPGNRKKLLKPSWSSPPPNGGVSLGEFVSQREKHYSGNSPVQRSKSSESPSENESDNPFLLSNFVKGRRHNNNHSNNVDHKQELTSMWNKIFMDASKRGDVSKMEQAHEKGADLYMRDSEGCTALHHAVRFAHTDVVDFMITKGGSKILNLLDTHRKQTALHKAAWYGRMDICIKLVEAGSLLHITDYKGKTAMERAKQSDSAELVEYLNNSHSGPTSLKNCLETDL